MANKIPAHQPIVMGKCNGLYNRGTVDTVPPSFLSTAINVEYNQGEVFTRSGSSLLLTKSNIVRFFIYRRLYETSRYIYLDSSGNLYDSLYPSTPILSDSSLIDFDLITIFNRAYISFHDRFTGLSGKSLYVYEGAGPGTIRLAAGAPPSSFTLGVVTSGTTGTIPAGIHIFAVAFETT